MNDEDSIWSWVLALVLGLSFAAGLATWPLVAWWIIVNVFK